jgi:hypothetical protein
LTFCFSSNFRPKLNFKTLSFRAAEKRLFLNKSETKFHKLSEGQARTSYLGWVVGGWLREILAILFYLYILGELEISLNLCDLTKSCVAGFGWSEVQPSGTVKSLLCVFSARKNAEAKRRHSMTQGFAPTFKGFWLVRKNYKFN